MTTRIGLIVPCDLTLDREYWISHQRGSRSTSRGRASTPGGLDFAFVRGVADLDEIAYATRSLSKIEPAVIAYACTSGSFIEGSTVSAPSARRCSPTARRASSRRRSTARAH